MNAGQDYLLIAEDDRDILKLLDATLTFKGYRVITAHNGKEALEVIQIKRPAIVITDIMMPKLDGFGLVHRLRLNPETRDIPVVFITATFMTPEDKEFALDIGATRFIQKPVDLDKFLITIAELLEPGPPPATEPLKEFNFYDGYRKRLEAKLERKNKRNAIPGWHAGYIYNEGSVESGPDALSGWEACTRSHHLECRSCVC